LRSALGLLVFLLLIGSINTGGGMGGIEGLLRFARSGCFVLRASSCGYGCGSGCKRGRFG
jgi:hypothetical protein